jgi:hypothetical protein
MQWKHLGHGQAERGAGMSDKRGRKTVTDPGDNDRPLNRHTCQACKQQKPLDHFTALPFDHRCNVCLPPDTDIAVLRDKQADEARRRLAAVTDSVERHQSLEPVERLLMGIYGAFGGSHVFCEYLAGGIKQLYEIKKTPQAVAASINLLRLNSKVDKLKAEDDWRQMDDATLKEALRMKSLGILAELAIDDAQKAALAILLAPPIEGTATPVEEPPDA